MTNGRSLLRPFIKLMRLLHLYQYARQACSSWAVEAFRVNAKALGDR
jgi:hypothetical protein